MTQGYDMHGHRHVEGDTQSCSLRATGDEEQQKHCCLHVILRKTKVRGRKEITCSKLQGAFLLLLHLQP